ncbi:thiopeptide-type bacteriocin biosynthesis protein [Nonomuraea muscovyensis]|uniref:thiopeptide-type bacteriocin biosynthesis protein n=1 Tax=Nonomuraea muscovyensis TaxID=1124761 RepID=UPI0033D98B9D
MYDPTVAKAERPWIAMHIYYTSNPNPLLLNCVQPLVRDLQRDGLIRRYFFIRYWLEGPHVRLRLLPAPGVDPAAITRIAEERVGEFLLRRPAVYEVDNEIMSGIYKDMYLAEYSLDQWNADYGENGTMPIQRNNSWIYRDYEPEFDRYGGPAGIELAEWHFEKSSDVVLSLIGRTNVHVRTVLLGLSAQLMMTMCATFIRDPGELAEFFTGYNRFWERTYESAGAEKHDQFDLLYEDMRERLAGRVAVIHAATAGDGEDSAPGAFLLPWARHCAELRDRIIARTRQGRLMFRARDGSDRIGAATDPELALRVLMGAYLHMTNNRLGVAINDEAYLAYLLDKAVRHGLGIGSAA